MKYLSIEDHLNQDHGLIDFTKDPYSTKIFDAELDELECEFNFDECVKIKTEKLSYITFSADQLRELIDLIEEAEEMYNIIL